MRILITIFMALSSYSALAKQVEVTCSTKAYACGSGGCTWVKTGTTAPFMVAMYKDPSYPNKDFPYEVFRANYQASYDRHFLTLKMEVHSLDPFTPVYVDAVLDAGSVFAEASAQGSLDIGIRNHNYGRGFDCSSIRALD